MSKERRLGRGLEALLGKVSEASGGDNAPKKTDVSRKPNVQSLQEALGSGRELPLEEMSTADESVLDPTSQPDPPNGEMQLRVVDFTADEHDEHDDEATETIADELLGHQPGPHRVDVRRIDPNPHQPRQDFDDAELQQLSDSIAEHGLLQPVVVREAGERYELVAGERRLRAAMKAGWNEVPVQVVEADDRHMAELAIIENVQRKDLNPLEKAASFRHYLDQYGCKQEDLAGRLNLDRSTVANLMRLLDLPEGVQAMLRQGKITQGHARSLLPLGDEETQIAFCDRILGEGWSVRQTEQAVQKFLADGGEEESPLKMIEKSAKQDKTSRHLAAMEQQFRSALGMKVKLSHNAKGRGKLVIQFASHDEFERVHALICGDEGKTRRAG